MPFRNTWVRVVNPASSPENEPSGSSADASAASSQPPANKAPAAKGDKAAGGGGAIDPSLYVAGFHPKLGFVSMPVEDVSKYTARRGTLRDAPPPPVLPPGVKPNPVTAPSPKQICVAPTKIRAVLANASPRQEKGKRNVYVTPQIYTAVEAPDPIAAEAAREKAQNSIVPAAAPPTNQQAEPPVKSVSAVSMSAALGSCHGDRSRAKVYHLKFQANMAQAAESGNNAAAAVDDFSVLEEVITSDRSVVLGMDADGDTKAMDGMAKIITQDATLRHNVVVINRGATRNTGKSHFFRETLKVALDHVAPVMERALQLYHDEKAREAEDEALAAAAAARIAATTGGGGGASFDTAGSFEAFGSAAKSESRKLSPSKRSPQRGGALSPRRPGTARSFTPRGRFTLLTTGEGYATPRTPLYSLTARGFDVNSPTRLAAGGASHGGVSWGEQTDDAKRGASKGPARNSTQFARRSSVKLRQALTMLLAEPRSKKLLRGNGYEGTWKSAAFNGRDSCLALEPIPNMEVVAPAFALDMWLRVEVTTRRPMTLLQICENDKSEVGMQIHVGLNFGTEEPDNDHLRFYFRDSANRVMEVHLSLTGRSVTDGQWHHLYMHARSVEETLIDVAVDGQFQDRLRYVQAEHPNLWNSFGHHHIWLGGLRDPSTGAVANPFLGQMCEFRLWCRDANRLEHDNAQLAAAVAEYNKVQTQLTLLDNDAIVIPTITDATGLSVPVTTKFGKLRKVAQQSVNESASLVPLLIPSAERDLVGLEPILRFPLMQPREEATTDSDGGEGTGEQKTFIDRVHFCAPVGVTGQRVAAALASPSKAASNEAQRKKALEGALLGTGHSEVFNVLPVESSAPTTSPWFDGKSSCINVGNLGEFGGFMQNFSIEVRFRTAVTDRMMCLVGVTDTQHKKAQLIIMLNAEPTLTSDRVRFHSQHTAFVLVDATGRVMAGILRGSDRASLSDGHWHTLTWKVLDSETNKMEVKVDGIPQDAVVSVRDGPKNFLPFVEWVCVGGHNNRGWRVTQSFVGTINRVAITLRGDTYAEWRFDEGPGAVMAVDRSGHGFHGAYFDAVLKTRHKHGMLWCLQNEEVNDAPADLDENGLAMASSPGSAKRSQLNLRNDVRFAVLNFTAKIDPSTGRAVEACYDMLAPPPKKAVASPKPTAKTRSDKPKLARNNNAAANAAKTKAAAEEGDQHSGSEGDGEEQQPSAPSKVEPDAETLAMDEFEDLNQNGPTLQFGAAEIELERGPTRITRYVRGLLPDSGREWTHVPDSCFVAAESTAHPKTTLTAVLNHISEIEKRQRLTALKQQEKKKGGGGAAAQHDGDELGDTLSGTVSASQADGAFPRIGHIVVIVAIGDSRLTFVDMKGPVLPPHSHYAPHMTKWATPVSTFGADNKITAVVNNAFAAVERVLITASHLPGTAKRCKLTMDPSVLEEQLRRQSYPTKLASVLYAGLVDTEFSSRSLQAYSLPFFHNEDEALSLYAPQRACNTTTEPVAAVMVQRLIRGSLGRKRFARIQAAKLARKAKVQQLGQLREANRLTYYPKDHLTATVIAVLNCHASKTSTTVDDHDTEADLMNSAALKTLSTVYRGANAATKQDDVAPTSDPTAVMTAVAATNMSLLPVVNHERLRAVLSGLHAQGYTVRLLLNPDGATITSTLKTLDPSHSHIVYLLGYGASTFAYPRFPKIDMLAFVINEEYLRANITADAISGFGAMKHKMERGAQRIAEDAAAAAAALAAKKGKGRRTPAPPTPKRSVPPSPAGPVQPTPPASPPSKRPGTAGGRGAGPPLPAGRGRGGRGGANASATVATAPQLSPAEQAMAALLNEEEQERQTHLVGAYDHTWMVILSEVKRAIMLLKEHESKYLSLAHGQLPLLIPRFKGVSQAPDPAQCLHVEKLIDVALKRETGTAPPTGFQCFVAAELLDPNPSAVVRMASLRQVSTAPSARSASILATSSGHTMKFFYKPGTSNAMTWQFAKALQGHIAANVANDQQAEMFVFGAVPGVPDDQRDAYTVLDYIARKLESHHALQPELQKKLPKADDLPETEVPYNGDLVPLRCEPSTTASRESMRKSLESKRQSGIVRLAVDAEKPLSEISGELRMHLSDLQSSEVVLQPVVLVTLAVSPFSPYLKHLENVDLAVIADAAGRVMSGNITCTVSLTPHGVCITMAGNDKGKLALSVAAVADKASQWKYPCLQKEAYAQTKAHDALRAALASGSLGPVPSLVDPDEGVTHFTVVKVRQVYSARGATTFKKWHRVLRRAYHQPELSPSCTIISATED